MKCKLCENQAVICPLHERDKERESRKSIWMSKATQHFDTPKIRKQALAIFNKYNPI